MVDYWNESENNKAWASDDWLPCHDHDPDDVEEEFYQDKSSKWVARVYQDDRTGKWYVKDDAALDHLQDPTPYHRRIDAIRAAIEAGATEVMGVGGITTDANLSDVDELFLLRNMSSLIFNGRTGKSPLLRIAEEGGSPQMGA